MDLNRSGAVEYDEFFKLMSARLYASIGAEPEWQAADSGRVTEAQRLEIRRAFEFYDRVRCTQKHGKHG